MTEAQLYGKLGALPRHLTAVVNRSMKRNAKEIIKRNQGQMLEGEDSLGNTFGGYKSGSHIRKRKKKGLQTDHIDLKFTGDFQKSMFIEFGGSGLTVSSKVDAKDDKKKWLIHHWTDEIFGLNDENFDWLTQQIVNDMVTDLKTYFT